MCELTRIEGARATCIARGTDTRTRNAGANSQYGFHPQQHHIVEAFYHLSIVDASTGPDCLQAHRDTEEVYKTH